jgi:8-oxo-dGTP pyrophosphatase MutT (NUDIX family)
VVEGKIISTAGAAVCYIVNYFYPISRMTLNREQLIENLKIYTSTFPEEQAFINMFINLLQHPRAYYRDRLPGHMTGSAWIVDESFEHVLLTHHAKLNKWLQPGGHADGDEDIFRVALREAEEETGLSEFRILSHRIFDVDIHTIPARGDFPEHLHFDVRILIQHSRQKQFTVTDESHDLAWVAIKEIADKTHQNVSMIRMAEKVRQLLTTQ